MHLIRIAVFFFCVAAAFTASAKRTFVGGLPASEYADTEVSTNLTFQSSGVFTDEISLFLDSSANPSNCLTVAFGRDADGDDILHEEEIGMSIGWDAGEWIIESKRAGGRTAWPSGFQGTAQLALNLVLGAKAKPKSLTVEFVGAMIFTSSSDLPQWLFDPTWDTVKVTARGRRLSAESIEIESIAAPLVIRLR